jgi:hypothetical protein
VKGSTAGIPPEMLTRGVRPGCEMVHGLPKPGERAHLTTYSSPDVFHDTWVLVSSVEDAYVPGTAWLYCIDLETRQRCRRYVWPDRLDVERHQPEHQTKSLGGTR